MKKLIKKYLGITALEDNSKKTFASMCDNIADIADIVDDLKENSGQQAIQQLRKKVKGLVESIGEIEQDIESKAECFEGSLSDLNDLVEDIPDFSYWPDLSNVQADELERVGEMVDIDTFTEFRAELAASLSALASSLSPG